jgi:hypothetical protein
MHRFAALLHRLDAGLARVRSYGAGSCPMPSTATWTVAPIFAVQNATKRRPRPLITSQ